MPSPLDALTWPRTTERLTIRPAAVADIEPTWEYRRRPEVLEWIGWGSTDRDYYSERFARQPHLDRTLVVLLDDRVIGDLMLSVGDAWAQAEIAELASSVQAELGWVLDPAYAGRGYATEAVTELIRTCFEDLRLRRVTATCFTANVASWRLMERLGMRREVHTVRDSLHRSGEWLDGYGYALLAEEWRR